MENLHKVYYRDYYSDITKANKCLTRNFGKGKDGGWDSVKTCLVPEAVADNGFETISATVQYPGLVTGIGLQHEINDVAEAMQLGLHLDYTSGMPVIYGSSVKGVLRSYFPFVYGGEHPKEMEDLIFGDNVDTEAESIYKRDIFFDAYVSEPNRRTGHVFDTDSITPHNESPFKNPVPISFLKIASGATVTFRFRLVDTTLVITERAENGQKMPKKIVYTAGQKKKDFTEILTTFGVGAKTNVGYGQLKVTQQDEPHKMNF